MSNFLEDFNELVDEGFHENACEMITGLGSNARRMLEIGIAQDELAKNPNARFSCNGIEPSVYNGDGIIEQIKDICQYGGEKPIVSYCDEKHLKVYASGILSDIAEQWNDEYEDYKLECSDLLKSKLQAVLDEIIAENKDRNISYLEGEELDIDEVWDELNKKTN